MGKNSHSSMWDKKKGEAFCSREGGGGVPLFLSSFGEEKGRLTFEGGFVEDYGGGKLSKPEEDSTKGRGVEKKGPRSNTPRPAFRRGGSPVKESPQKNSSDPSHAKRANTCARGVGGFISPIRMGKKRREAGKAR